MKRHLIIGDLIFDRFIYGNATRISAEAPTLVLDTEDEVDMLGGAYNVAAHICSLGHNVNFISVVGNDYDSVVSTFNDNFHLNSNCFITKEAGRKTTVKTRLISKYKNAHLLRYDNESTHPLLENTENEIIEYVKNNISLFDDILLIDYKKGVITKKVAESIIEIANMYNIPVLVDTKRDDLSIFTSATVIKPNKYEFEKIRLRYASDFSMEEACRIICNKLRIQKIVITAGNDGIYAYDSVLGLIHSKAEEVKVKELSGAGDSVLAVLSFCFLEGHSFEESIGYANKLAAKFVSSGIQYRAKLEDLMKGNKTI